MQSYNVVLSTEEATVVAEYSPEKQNRNQYQSEAELEDAMKLEMSLDLNNELEGEE